MRVDSPQIVIQVDPSYFAALQRHVPVEPKVEQPEMPVYSEAVATRSKKERVLDLLDENPEKYKGMTNQEIALLLNNDVTPQYIGKIKAEYFS